MKGKANKFLQSILIFILLSVFNYLGMKVYKNEIVSYSVLSISHFIYAAFISFIFYILQNSSFKLVNLYFWPIFIAFLSSIVVLFDFITNNSTEIGELMFVFLSNISLLYGNTLFLIINPIDNHILRTMVAYSYSIIFIPLLLLFIIIVSKCIVKKIHL